MIQYSILVPVMAMVKVSMRSLGLILPELLVSRARKMFLSTISASHLTSAEVLVIIKASELLIYLGKTFLTTSMIWGLDSFPSGKPTLKVLQSSTISLSVSVCPCNSSVSQFSHTEHQTVSTTGFVIFRLRSSLSSSTFLAFRERRCGWTCGISLFIVTESIKVFRFSGISSSCRLCLDRFFLI